MVRARKAEWCASDGFTDPAKQRDVPDAVLRMTGLTRC
jgi:hypothetical protein